MSRPPISDDAPLVVPVRREAAARARAVELAWERHYRDVYRYVLALTRSADEADEVAAETFGRALRHWQDAPDRPLPWLLLTARRFALDRWRRARRLVQSGLQRHSRSTESSTQSTEFWLWFEAVAAVLTERQREVLVLRYQQDLSDSDIGAVMGLSESGVRSLVARALDGLRSHPELRP